MTMLTSADAINAEIEYRRERVRLASRPVRRRRATRRERARQIEQVRLRRMDGAGRDDQRGAVTLPAQRTSETSSKTKQPV